MLVLLLTVYLLYLSAQRPPTFYKESIAVAPDIQQSRNKEMLRKVRNLNNDIQKVDTPWTGSFADDDLNGYLAVEVAKESSNLFPKEIKEPRLSIKNRELEFACRVEEGPLVGILHLTLGISVSEPNALTIRIKKVKLGRLPISRDKPKEILLDALKKQGYEVKEGTEDGDPTLTIPLHLKYDQKKTIEVDDIELLDGGIRLSGLTLETDAR